MDLSLAQIFQTYHRWKLAETVGLMSRVASSTNTEEQDLLQLAAGALSSSSNRSFCFAPTDPQHFFYERVKGLITDATKGEEAKKLVLKAFGTDLGSYIIQLHVEAKAKLPTVKEE